MAQGDLRAALEYASQNPKSDFATQLNQRIISGQADAEAQKLGLDLTPIKQYVAKQNPVADTTIPIDTRPNTKIDSNSPIAKAFPKTDSVHDIGVDMGKTFKQGGDNVVQDVQNIPKNADAAGGSVVAKTASILSGAGHVAGDVAGTAGNLIGNVISPLIPDAVKSKVGDVASYLNDKIGQIPGMTPDIHKSLGDVFNALTLEGGAKAEPVVADITKTALQKGADVFDSTTKAISDNAKSTLVAKQVAKQSDFIDKLITPEMNAKATASAIKTGKVVEGEGILGKRDLTSAVPNFDAMKASVEKVPGISAKNTALQNANLIHDAIGTTAEDLKSQLKGKGSFTPSEFKDYMTGVKNTLAENPLITGDAETTANKIINKFNSLIKTNGYDAEGLLNARQQLDKWMSSQKGGSVFDPKTETAVSTALRGIRQGGNDFIASKVPDVAVKDMLSHQSNLYKVIDNIAPKAAKEGTSKLSRAANFVKKNPVATAFVGDKILKATTGLGY